VQFLTGKFRNLLMISHALTAQFLHSDVMTLVGLVYRNDALLRPADNWCFLRCNQHCKNAVFFTKTTGRMFIWFWVVFQYFYDAITFEGLKTHIFLGNAVPGVSKCHTYA
jgi:hypothetical protein